MKGSSWWLPAAVGLCSCGAHGVLEYRSGIPTTFRAEFAADDGCSINSHLRIAATRTKFYLFDGRESYSWLGLNPKYRGLEVESYYKDKSGHHFSFRERRRAWQYHIPDEVGANGIMEYFEDNKLEIVAVEDGFRVVGEPFGQCELVYVGAPGRPLTREPAQTPAPPPCVTPEPTASSEPTAPSATSPASDVPAFFSPAEANTEEPR